MGVINRIKKATKALLSSDKNPVKARQQDLKPVSTEAVLDQRAQNVGLRRAPAGTVVESDEIDPRRNIIMPRTAGAGFGGNRRQASVFDPFGGNIFSRLAMAHPHVYAATRMIAKAVARTPWNFMPIPGDMQSEALLEFLIRFISTPNDQESTPKIMHRTSAAILTVGRVYWEIQYDAGGEPASYYLIEGEVREHRDKEGKWLKPAITQRVPNREEVPFNVGEFMSFRNPSPVSEVAGEPTMEPLLDIITADLLAYDWNKRFLKQAASPSGVFIFPAGLSDDEMRRNDAAVEQAVQGNPNAGRPFIALEGEVQFTPLPSTPKDYDFIEGRQQNMASIATVFGIPVSMLEGKTEITPAMKREFQENAVDPVLLSLECGINEFFKSLDMNGGWRFLFTPRAVVDERAKSRQADIGARHGVITPNEMRRILDPTLPRLDDGDDLIVPITIQRANISATDGGQIPSKSGDTVPRVPAGSKMQKVDGLVPLDEPSDPPHQHTTDFPFGEACDKKGEPNGKATKNPHAHTDEFPGGVNTDGETNDPQHAHTEEFPCGELVEFDVTGAAHPMPKRKKRSMEDLINDEIKKAAERLKTKFTPKESACISAKIKKVIKEGKSMPQAIAIAISICAPGKARKRKKMSACGCENADHLVTLHQGLADEISTRVKDQLKMFTKALIDGEDEEACLAGVSDKSVNVTLIDAMKPAWLLGAAHAIEVLKKRSHPVDESLCKQVPAPEWDELRSVAVKYGQGIMLQQVKGELLRPLIAEWSQVEVENREPDQFALDVYDRHEAQTSDRARIAEDVVRLAFESGLQYTYRWSRERIIQQH